MVMLIQRTKLGLLVFFAIALSITSLLPDTARLPYGVPLIGLALAGLGAYGWLHYWLEPKFYFEDYVHAER